MLGITFNILRLTGFVTMGGSGVSGAVVRLVRQSTDAEVMKVTTAADGSYTFTGYLNQVLPGENYHIFVEYTNGGTKYNAKSLWNVVPVLST